MSEKHKCKFSKIKEWLDVPIEDHNVYEKEGLRYEVLATCDCGKNRQREATVEEVYEFFKKNSCHHCGAFHETHIDKEDCIKYLRRLVINSNTRLRELEKITYGMIDHLRRTPME